MAKEKILIVDDEYDIRHLIYRYLTKEQYTVITAENGNRAIELLKSENPDLVVLDIFLPDIDGFEVCQELRKFSNTPIIFLSSKSDDMDKILALGLGGDDYITKPFSLSELAARIKAHLRRNRLLTSDNKGNTLKFPGLKIDLTKLMVYVNDKLITLSAKEFQLLSALAQNPNRLYSSEQLFDLFWGRDNLGDTRTVAVHISNLRKKIENDPANPIYILTVRNMGYKFNSSLDII